MDATPDILRPLADLSARLGADIALVQAAGGNTSLKTADTLWIKASGTWLAEALARPIFVPLDRQALAAAVNGPPADIDAGVAAARRGGGRLLPSIETSLHALMPHRVVVHVHGVNTLAHAMLRDGRERVAARLAGLPFVWVPYVRPGAPLTVLVREALARAPADILILENHGPVVGADTEVQAERLMREVEARLALPPRPIPAPDLAALEELAAACGLQLPRGAEAHAAALDPHALALAARGAFYPDHVVFLGRSPQQAIDAGDLRGWLDARRARGEADPSFVLVPRLGILANRALGDGGHELLRCLGLVLPRVPAEASVKALTAADENDLLDWDAEKYRQSLNEAAGRS
ncbi:short chain dehydrogenase [bacterium YEK0313]|nr:short chain dehydrogenase [bacterium YEK0313]